MRTGNVTRTGEMKNAYKIWYENPQTRDHFEDRRKTLKLRIKGRECDLTDSGAETNVDLQ
jgi:hypothetical protein